VLRPVPSDELRTTILAMRAKGEIWQAIAGGLGSAESTAIYHAKRAGRRLPRYRPIIATSRSPGYASASCAR
jgi:hypothetical protein